MPAGMRPGLERNRRGFRPKITCAAPAAAELGTSQVPPVSWTPNAATAACQFHDPRTQQAVRESRRGRRGQCDTCAGAVRHPCPRPPVTPLSPFSARAGCVVDGPSTPIDCVSIDCGRWPIDHNRPIPAAARRHSVTPQPAPRAGSASAPRNSRTARQTRRPAARTDHRTALSQRGHRTQA